MLPTCTSVPVYFFKKIKLSFKFILWKIKVLCVFVALFLLPVLICLADLNYIDGKQQKREVMKLDDSRVFYLLPRRGIASCRQEKKKRIGSEEYKASGSVAEFNSLFFVCLPSKGKVVFWKRKGAKNAFPRKFKFII